MLEKVYKKQFVKDLALIQKQGFDLTKLDEILRLLVNGYQLPKKNRNHKLHGEFVDHWECHIQGDWLLIYYKTDTELILVRTGSHSNLF